MIISIFELFKIGIGPSSSHTVGPMKAAYAFNEQLIASNLLSSTTRICVELYGSLALTGKGHGTDIAILNGLSGQQPDSVDPQQAILIKNTIQSTGQLCLQQRHDIAFHPETDLLWYQRDVLPHHTNGMRFSAYHNDTLLLSDEYYSIGGGFIVTADTFGKETTGESEPFPFDSAKTLIQHCETQSCTIAELMLKNEESRYSNAEIQQRLLSIANTMRECIARGCESPGILPGGLNVKRRAPELYQKLKKTGQPSPDQQSDMMNWLNLYAMAVNEENAAGGRIVTAPTNGAAGVVPSVLNYYINYHKGVSDAKIIEFLLTAGAIATLYKKGASISGAEVGCQGEVGVASSMAAAALTAVLGGSIAQVENAAEIAMEHHLGMTCDPVGGLVQIPCIERNAMGAVKAVNAARLALMEDGEHLISLDKVIATMHQTGKDMMTIYKETSLGGLAVNIIEC